MITTADGARRYALEVFIEPARQGGGSADLSAAAEVLEGMRLRGRYPVVCTSIDADKFLDTARVVLVGREVSTQNTTVRWVYDLKG